LVFGKSELKTLGKRLENSFSYGEAINPGNYTNRVETRYGNLSVG
jgi:hypothetical protein